MALDNVYHYKYLLKNLTTYILVKVFSVKLLTFRVNYVVFKHDKPEDNKSHTSTLSFLYGEGIFL